MRWLAVSLVKTLAVVEIQVESGFVAAALLPESAENAAGQVQTEGSCLGWWCGKEGSEKGWKVQLPCTIFFKEGAVGAPAGVKLV